MASCPDDPTKTKNKNKVRTNRYQRFEAKNPDAQELKLPELYGAEYLVNLLHEAGPVGSNGYGMEGLKWSEIDSWLSRTGLFLYPWQVILIKEMSEVYASEFNKSNGVDCPPPYMHKPPTKQEFDDKLTAIFMGMQVKKYK